MSLGEPRIEYVEARRVLLDVLVALDAHRASLVLVGAQAVYLRCAGRLTTYQPFTTDADVVIDPSTLGSRPPLESAMTEAGFVPSDQPGTWEARFERAGFADTVVVPVDLIVPSQVAAPRGSRAARLPDPHGKRTARKTDGLEGALVDHDNFVLAALEPSDRRTVNVNVAGVAALLVAKSHKLGERIATPARLHAKDAGDVYRLFDATDADAMSGLLRSLLADERSASATEEALSYVQQLFRTPRSIGVVLATDALRGTLPEETVTASMTAYVRDLLERLGQ